MKEVAVVGVFSVDGTLRIRSWDAWLERATNLTADSVIGRSLTELFPDIEARGMARRIAAVIEHGTVAVLAPAFHHYLIPCAPPQPSSRFRNMQQHVTIAPLRANGGIAGAVITIEDVTERVEHELELAAQLKSDDVGQRLRAASELARSSHGGAEPLVDVLGDTEWTVRRAAVEGLARSPTPASNRALITALRDQHRDLAVLNAALSTLASAPQHMVSEVGKLLLSDDKDLRAYAALALGLMADPAAIALLLPMLDDADANVRFHVIEALGRLRAHEAIEPLSAIAESDDFFGAFAAIDALAMIGESSVVGILLPLLERPDLREAVANALGGLANEAGAVPLAQLINQDEHTTAALASAMSRLSASFQEVYQEGGLIASLARKTITAQGATHLVQALLNARDEELRDLVVVVGWLDFEGVDEALSALLSHPTVGFDVVDALVRRGGRAVDVLIKELEHGNPAALKPAALALGRIGNARSVSALIRLLSGPPDVITVAASALGSIGSSEAFEPLLHLFGHEQASVRQAAVSAINSIGHPDTSARINDLLQDPSPLVREAAARVAGYFGFAECFERILLLREDPDERVRRVVVEHLALFDDSRAIDALAASFKSTEPAVRASAARAAAQLPESSARPLLIKALDDTDLWVRYHAARSLGSQRSREAADVLCDTASSDPAVPVRSAAIDALGLIGAPQAAPMLAWLALHDEREIAIPAIEALGPMADADGRRTLMKLAAGVDAERRTAALRSLARRADASSVAEIAGLALAQAGSQTMYDAIQALSRAANPEAHAALMELTRHPTARAAAISALATLGFDTAPTIQRALDSADEEVRHAAVEALGRMKDSRATALLSSALADDSARVRTSAAQALARLDLQRATARRPESAVPR